MKRADLSLLPVLSFKYTGIFPNVVEMPSHDINTSMQQLYSKYHWTYSSRKINGPFDHRVSSSAHHNIEVSAHHWSLPVWTPFCLQNCLNSLWPIQQGVGNIAQRFWSILFGPHDSITQLLQICRLHIHDANDPPHPWSTTSQRRSIELRSGDCGGHLRKVNSLSCSRNQSKMIWALWQCIILLEVHQKMVHCSHKGMDMVSNNTQVGCGI